MNGGFSYVDQIGRPGWTALRYLAERYDHSDASVWRCRFAAGEITVDGATAGPDTVLRAGAVVTWRRPPWEEEDVPLSYEVLFAGEHALVVAKPSGLPTVPNGGFLEHTLLHLVRRRFPDATPMHRLGRGTSGLVLFALSADGRTVFQDAFRHRRVHKLYRALVSGHPPPVFTVDAPIGPVPHRRLGTVFAASADGRPALSRAVVVEQRPDSALVEVTIETGRPHQIRIHMARAGYPLVGDPLYLAGGASEPDALPGDVGYLLHAMELEFPEPGGGSRRVISPAPPSLCAGG